MKKLVFFLAFIGFFASCDVKRDGYADDLYWFVKEYTVASNQWELVNGVDQVDSYYKYSVDIHQLNREILKRGNIFCYMYRDNNVQTPLPFTIHYGEKDGDSDYLWTETYSFEFTLRTITFYVNYSDFKTNNRPRTTTFRVVLND